LNKILLDTNSYVAFKRGEDAALDIVRTGEFLVLSTVVIGELLAGFAAGRRETDNRRELTAFLDSPRVRVLGVDIKTADFYAVVWMQLRRQGKPIPSNDLWIAATALQHGLAVFTYDQHFQDIDGLRTGTVPADFLP